VCASLLLVQVHAQESMALPPPTQPTSKELNDRLALRAKLMIEAHKIEADINKAANDPAMTSPEIEILRKKVEVLQNEIIKAYSSIRVEIEKRPEIKEMRKQISEKEKQIEELNQKINEPIVK
jgi:predicted RNase H-like nuclease (RuvC/YqgF family)